MKKVVIITDCVDLALNEIRGAIYDNSNGAEFVIEPTVEVVNYSVINAAFATRLLADIYPEGTTISVILNPLKQRTERIIGRTKEKNIIFEGTNTGVFGWLIEDLGCAELYELFDPGFIQFGGKHVHAPAIGRSLHMPLNQLGNKFDIDKLRETKLEEGTILHIDNFGNIKLNYKFENVSNGDSFRFIVNGAEHRAKYYGRMMDGIDGELVVYNGSSFGFAEIGIVRGNAAQTLGSIVGERITLEKRK